MQYLDGFKGAGKCLLRSGHTIYNQQACVFESSACILQKTGAPGNVGGGQLIAKLLSLEPASTIRKSRLASNDSAACSVATKPSPTVT